MARSGATLDPWFDDASFEAFAKEKQRDAKYNADRLKVKRRLAALGKAVRPALEEADLRLAVQTSLSHPYTYNAFRVDSMWVYFSRPEGEKKFLREIFGRALGKDLDPGFQHVLLLVGIDSEGVEVSLKIHSSAWWDGQNLKNRCRRDADLLAFLEVLNALPGFVLSIHDWKKEYRCGSLRRSDLANYFAYYTPGEHWLHLRKRYGRDDPRVRGEAWVRIAGDDLRSLAPAYRFAAWGPENNHLGLREEGGPGGAR